ncbi:MAG: hypothetical protein RI575_17005 [Balneolaceae bacterium]|nr:hypothetical protein [Balneolaceae bacterium]MDR9410459.1 hypothetical protein [Balneolaceae bacterium]
MTRLLKQAFDKVSQLSEDEQDTIAALILKEIESEKKWEDTFESSQDELSKLGEEALAEHRAGKTKRLDPDTL